MRNVMWKGTNIQHPFYNINRTATRAIKILQDTYNWLDVPLGLLQILPNITDEFLDVSHFSLILLLLPDNVLYGLWDVLYFPLISQLIVADGYQLGMKTLLGLYKMNDENL